MFITVARECQNSHLSLGQWRHTMVCFLMKGTTWFTQLNIRMKPNWQNGNSGTQYVSHTKNVSIPGSWFFVRLCSDKTFDQHALLSAVFISVYIIHVQHVIWAFQRWTIEIHHTIKHNANRDKVFAWKCMSPSFLKTQVQGTFQDTTLEVSGAEQDSGAVGVSPPSGGGVAMGGPLERSQVGDKMLVSDALAA